MEQLSSHDVCVLHLSTLFEEAMKEHTASDTGMLISYDDISNSNGTLMCITLGLQVHTQETKDRINDILSMRSNSRSSKKKI